MKEKHIGCKRGFYRHSKAWYYEFQPIKEVDINFGMYADDESTSGEMKMVWEDISGKLVPRLKCFNDTWDLLPMFADLLNELADFNGQDITEPFFAELLKQHCFKDLTNYTKEI